MGMAASQARFLAVTARKNNVEYEAQQINQERTSLANQSATYYSSLMDLRVPTPPSSDLFTKTVYTFSQSGESQEATKKISQISKSANGKYSISYSYIGYDQSLEECAASEAMSIKMDGTDYYYGSTKLLQYSELDSDDQVRLTDTETALLNAGKITNLDQVYMLKQLVGDEYTYKYFIDTALPTGSTPIDVQYWSWKTTESYKTGVYENCELNRDKSGNLVSFTTSGGTNIAVTTSNVKDQIAYEEAYNQYKYETYKYDQELAAINASIEIVQTQDKTLELRLKQLDTEQNALSTEMESLKKVIEKNVEDSFKTFA